MWNMIKAIVVATYMTIRYGSEETNRRLEAQHKELAKRLRLLREENVCLRAEHDALQCRLRGGA